MNLGADTHREPWVNKTFCIWTFLFVLKRVGPPAGSEDKHSSEKLKYHPCVHLPPGADLTGTSSVPLINSASSGDRAGQPGWLCALSLQGRDGQSPVCRAGTLGRARLHSHCTAPADSPPPGRARAKQERGTAGSEQSHFPLTSTWVKSSSKPGYSLPSCLQQIFA